MKISLKKILISEIQRRGMMTIDELEQLCKDAGYKISNYERRLRESRTLVEPVFSKKAIVGYRYIGKEPQKIEVYFQRQQSLI